MVAIFVKCFIYKQQQLLQWSKSSSYSYSMHASSVGAVQKSAQGRCNSRQQVYSNLYSRGCRGGRRVLRA